MSTVKTHAIVGSIFAIGTLLIIRQNKDEPTTLGELLGVGRGGAAIKSLPEIIDPPTNPNHRSIGHSVSGAIALGFMMKNLNDNPNISDKTKNFILPMKAAYASHLILDADTPARLPLLSN